MCHGQAIQLAPLRVETCRGCGESAMIYQAELRLGGERTTVRLCGACARTVQDRISKQRKECQ